MWQQHCLDAQSLRRSVVHDRNQLSRESGDEWVHTYNIRVFPAYLFWRQPPLPISWRPPPLKMVNVGKQVTNIIIPHLHHSFVNMQWPQLSAAALSQCLTMSAYQNESKGRRRLKFSSKEFPPVQRAFSIRRCLDIWPRVVVDWPSGPALLSWSGSFADTGPSPLFKSTCALSSIIVI